MQRGSDRLSVRKDDEMKHELQGLLRSGHATRVEEWHDPEPAADDDPVVASGPVPSMGSVGPDYNLEVELARHLSRAAFPATPAELVPALEKKQAPARLIELMGELPAHRKFRTAHEVAAALAPRA